MCRAAVQVVMADIMGSAVRRQASALHGTQDLPAIGVVDPASDMWAIGCIAWVLFTGQLLFAGDTADADVACMLMGAQPLPFEEEEALWTQFEEVQVCMEST